MSLFTRRTKTRLNLLRSIAFVVLLNVLLPSIGWTAPWWQSSVNVESKVGTDRSIQSLDVMYPLAHTKHSLTFTDLRGRIDDDQSVEVNLGLAHRSVRSDPLGLSDESVLGFYGFFDRLESRYDNTFYQATAGFEYFTKDYSLRINGYLPKDERKPTTSFTRLQATGTQIFFEERRNFERPLPGFDVELGRTVRFDGWQLYGRGSYFRFHDSNVAEIEGERFRTGVQIPGSTFASDWSDATQLTLGAEWQSDDVRGDQTFGVVRMRVPFGSVGSRGSGVESQGRIEDRKSNIENGSPSSTSQGSATSPTGGEGNTKFSPSTGEKRKEGESTSKESKSSPFMGEETDGGEQDSRLQTHDSGLTTQDSRLSAWQKDRLTERIERDVDIVTGDQSNRVDTQPAVLSTSGEALMDVAVARGGASGKGTFNDPGDLSAAISTAGDSGTVFLVGQLRTSGVTLLEGQTMIGGNVPVIKSADGSVVSSLAPQTSEPHVQGTSSDPTVRIDTGTSGYHLANFSIGGSGDALSFGNGVSNARVEDVRVTRGDVTVGDDAGRGNGNRFVLKRVEVGSGRLEVGGDAGAENGTFTMSDVAVSGPLDVGFDAGSDGGLFSMTKVRSGGALEIGTGGGATNGTFTMTDVKAGGVKIGGGGGASDGNFSMTNVTSEGTLNIGNNAGSDSGSFTMNRIEVGDGVSIGAGAGFEDGFFTMKQVRSGGSVKIDPSAGENDGLFRMKDVSFGGALEIGSSAGANSGSFTMSSVTSGGTLEIGENAGRTDGSFEMSQVSSEKTLRLGESVGREGTFTMSGVEVSSGDLIIGEFAGEDGAFTMKEVSATGNVTIADKAAWQNGSFTMQEVTSGGTLTIGRFAGNTSGSFSMRKVTSEETLTIGKDAGGSLGSVTLADVTSGQSLKIGASAGRFDGSFTMKDVTSEGTIDIADNVGRNKGSFTMENVEIMSGDLLVGDNAGAVNGTLSMDTVAVTDGFVDLGKWAGGDPTASNNGGVAKLTNITVGDSLSVVAFAGKNDGSFTMADVKTGADVSIGVDAGFSGSFKMTNVNTRGSLDVGSFAGAEGSFLVKKLRTAGPINIREGAGGAGAFALVDSTVKGDLTTGTSPSGSGSFNLLLNEIDGDLNFDGTMDTCLGNIVTGSISTDASACQ